MARVSGPFLCLSAKEKAKRCPFAYSKQRDKNAMSIEVLHIYNGGIVERSQTADSPRDHIPQYPAILIYTPLYHVETLDIDF